MKKQSFLIKNYKACWEFLKESKWHVVFSLAVFCIFVIIGFAFPIFFQEQIFSFMKEMLLKLEGLNVYETTGFIFFNNLKAGFFAIVFGVVLGIFPLATGIANGYLLGFVARYATTEGGIFVLWRLLPHGIFELPAIILSIGFGLKIGFEIWKKDSGKILRRNFKESMRFFVFVIFPLLLVAGIIEGVLIFFVG